MSSATYSDVKAYLSAKLGAETGPRRIVFSPGPAGDTQEQKIAAARIVFLEVGGGPGLHLEDTFDRIFIAARMVGMQRSYDDAETLARDVDLALVSFAGTADLTPGVRGLYITRAGGRPQLLLRDSAERYHFTASYIGEFESGI